MKLAEKLLDLRVFMSLTSHLLVDLLAQQARGLDKKHDNQHGEHERVAQLGRNVGLAQNLDHAQQDAADERARNGADAAEDRRGEGLDAGMAPVVGMSTG